jgi:hypothetical protein
MALFEIQHPSGGTFEVDAPDQASALAAFKKFSGPNAAGRKVTDPALLAQLNSPDAPTSAGRKVTDPALLAQLNATDATDDEMLAALRESPPTAAMSKMSDEELRGVMGLRGQGAGGGDEWAEFRTKPADPWSEFRVPQTLDQKRAVAMASARARIADAEAPATVPLFDAMGNPTGGVEPAAPASTMSYGDQMKKVGGLVDDGARLLANGATFGLADKFAGGMDAVTGNAENYDQGVKAQRAETQSLRNAAPTAAAVTEGVGGLFGGLGLMKNGVSLIGRLGTGFVPKAATFGAEGAAYGAAHGAGNTYSENPQDYIDAAKHGAKWGGTVGALLPVAGGLGAGVGRAVPAMVGQNLPGLGWGASTLVRGAGRADAPGLSALSGDAAMLVDAGPAMVGLGQGAGTATGPGRTALVNALRERDAGTGERLGRGIDEALGPAPIPSRVEAGLSEGRRALSPEYERVLGEAQAVDTSALAGRLEALAVDARGAAGKALRDVRGMLDIPGNPGNLDPSPRALLNTRHAIDGQMAGESNTNVLRLLGDARRAVDEELGRTVPGIKGVDAKFEELARQSGGLQRGGQVFDNGKTATRPVELADELAAGTNPAGELVGPSGEAFRLRQGARAEVDRLQGTHVNDLNTLERTLGTPQDWNHQKFGQVFGQDPRDEVVKLLSRERTQRGAYQDIVQGAQSAQRLSSAKSMDGSDGIPLDTTLTGAGSKLTAAIARTLLGMSRQSRKDQIGTFLANQGPEAQALARAILEGEGSRAAYSKVLGRVLGAPEMIGLSAPSYGPSARR